ncbi:hypothetical protein [Aestuariivirga sp.]|uniref:hypothetical protein n=1 Tax=Aestuariivirga sp. TaxID=2650926 RepID=UPI0039E24E2F
MNTTGLAVDSEAMSEREEIEAAIEQLIALLDAMDGDPDLEPSLGMGDAHGADDRERDDADDEDCGDSEPWLAAPERHPPLPPDHSVKTAILAHQRPDLFRFSLPERTDRGHQLAWADGDCDDGEIDIDDEREPDGHDELWEQPLTFDQFSTEHLPGSTRPR